MLKTIINPYEINDYYEARTDDLNSPVIRSKKYRLSGYLSSDYRNRFALDFGGGIVHEPLYSARELRWRISPRFRFNDKISMKYVLSVRDRYNEIGYLDDIAINDEELPEPILSLRNTYMITNVLSGEYIINNKIDFSFKLRYHIDQVENIEYRRLKNDGYLTSIDGLSIPEVSSYDINYSTWTSDIGLSWWFAPGSQLSLVWKNGIDNQTNILKRNWFDNVNDSFSLSQENSLSLKVVYYLDYLYLKKGFKND
jgi:hypothetical protein